jgi:DNA-binding NarL/FixJ family response regulator
VSKTIRVLIAEDHETVRTGLKLLIDSQPDMKVIGEAADGEMAVQRAHELHPDVVVMDVSMPRMNGLVATRTIRQTHADAAVVTLTRYTDEAYLQELLRAGALGYVLKQSASPELLQAIRAAAAGRQYLDASLTARVAGTYLRKHSRQRTESIPDISDREAQVLRLIAWGHSNKEVAAELDVSVKTVEVHKANAMRKLGLKGRIDIVRYALLQGWLTERAGE